MADPFPLYVPPEARRLFQSESLLRRFAQTAHWSERSTLLELHGSLGALAITKALGCHLTVLEPEQRLADALKERARVVGVGDKVGVQHGAVDSIKFAERAFDGIFSFGRVIGLPGAIARHWRPFLAQDGRLGVTAMVRVGRNANDAVLAAWKDRLGAAVVSPRETLMAIEAEGYEPELIETLGEGELDEYYRELEGVLGRTADKNEAGHAALKAEIALHRSGKTGVTIGFIVARRKEPGEKPPPSRDGG
ncbi:MAG: SAM-dependent methyltransferase [Myxococcota bacterium]